MRSTKRVEVVSTCTIVTSIKLRHTDLQECDFKSNLDATNRNKDNRVVYSDQWKPLVRIHCGYNEPRSTSRKEDDLWDLRG